MISLCSHTSISDSHGAAGVRGTGKHKERRGLRARDVTCRCHRSSIDAVAIKFQPERFVQRLCTRSTGGDAGSRRQRGLAQPATDGEAAVICKYRWHPEPCLRLGQHPRAEVLPTCRECCDFGEVGWRGVRRERTPAGSEGSTNDEIKQRFDHKEHGGARPPARQEKGGLTVHRTRSRLRRWVRAR